MGKKIGKELRAKTDADRRIAEVIKESGMVPAWATIIFEDEQGDKKSRCFVCASANDLAAVMNGIHEAIGWKTAELVECSSEELRHHWEGP